MLNVEWRMIGCRPNAGSKNLISVMFFLGLTPKFRSTFQNISAVLQNIQISRRIFLSLFFGAKTAVFATLCHTVIYSQTTPPLLSNSGVGPRRGAFLALSRGCYCIATGLPLQLNGHAVVIPRNPYCSTNPAFSPFFGHQKLTKFFKNEEPRGPYGIQNHFLGEVSSGF